jgi:hypothetical protein
MTDFNQRQDGKTSQKDRSVLDLELDASLARYAAVEPRPGLDERILTNLRAEKLHAPAHGWWKWKWTALATLAAILLVALTLFWSGERRRNNVARNRSLTPRDGVSTRTPVTENGGGKLLVAHPAAVKKPATHVHQAPAFATSGPRLDQFPSPRPLSEQEKILQSYVAKYPEHAALVAQARAEALRQDLAEQSKMDGTETSQQ